MPNTIGELISLIQGIELGIVMSSLYFLYLVNRRIKP